MSIKMMSLVWEQATIGGSELLVLLALADYANDEGGSIYPSMQSIAKKARLSVDQTRRVIHKLIAEGRIELVEQGGWDGKRNRSNEYRILLDAKGVLANCKGGTRADASTVLAPMQDDPSYNHHRVTTPPPTISDYVQAYQRFWGLPVSSEQVSDEIKDWEKRVTYEGWCYALKECADTRRVGQWKYFRRILERLEREGYQPKEGTKVEAVAFALEELV